MSSLPISEEPLSVVVIDDTPDLRDLLRMALERRGEFRVIAEAGNGLDGVSIVEGLQPDVVLLDIAMPVMDGLEALPLVRAVCPRATIVMLSGFGAAEMTQRSIAGGADGYLQKGQPIGTLLAQVRAFTDETASRRGYRVPPASGRTPPTAHAPGSTGAPSSTESSTEPSADPITDPITGPITDPITGPASEQPAGPPESGDITAERPPVLDHLELAPIGFLHVRDGMVLRGNREAGRLFGDISAPGLRLDAFAPLLIAHLRQHPGGESSAVLELGDPPRRVLVSVRRTGSDFVVYLQPEADDETDLLRRSIATTAHEIRTPVSILGAAAEALMDEELAADVDRDRMLAVIVRQATLLDVITADLLTAGQAQHGTLTVQLQPLAASELVRLAVEEIPDVTVVDTCTEAVLTDPHRFQQMIGNLLVNARKYGAAPFVVRLRSEGREVAIDVEDGGAGVPEEFRSRLFQEYSRASGTHAAGTGLGLFVVRALAEAQGGSAAYAPRQPRGSVFTIRLPAAPA